MPFALFPSEARPSHFSFFLLICTPQFILSHHHAGKPCERIEANMVLRFDCISTVTTSLFLISLSVSPLDRTLSFSLSCLSLFLSLSLPPLSLSSSDFYPDLSSLSLSPSLSPDLSRSPDLPFALPSSLSLLSVISLRLRLISFSLALSRSLPVFSLISY